MTKWPVLGKHNLHHQTQQRKNYRCHPRQILLKPESLTGSGGVSPVHPGHLGVRYSVLQLRSSLVCAGEGELPSQGHSGHFNSAASAGTSSFPSSGGQGGTELFFSQHRELQHLSTDTDRWHSHVCSLL